MIDVCPGLASCAICYCGKAVRQLYAPPEVELFACRHCWKLIHRRKTEDPTAWERLMAGPAIDDYAALPWRVRHRAPRNYVEKPPAVLAAELAGELPLAPQELRLWSLRLRACGLSYRQIARLTESSKSTVARLCLEGREGIDPFALTGERLERAPGLPSLSEDAGPAEWRDLSGAIAANVRALGVEHRPWVGYEKRVVRPPAD